MGDGDQNKFLHLLGWVVLSRWQRSCKGSFPHSPPIHLCFPFLPFLPDGGSKVVPCFGDPGSSSLRLWGKTEITGAEAPTPGGRAGGQGSRAGSLFSSILSCAGSQEV